MVGLFSYLPVELKLDRYVLSVLKKIIKNQKFRHAQQTDLVDLVLGWFDWLKGGLHTSFHYSFCSSIIFDETESNQRISVYVCVYERERVELLA